MVLKKPTKEQYEALFGPLDGQIRTVLALAFEDDGTRMFANEESASYRKFREVVEALKKMTEDDSKAEAYFTSGLTCIDLFVREVDNLFAIADQEERFSQLKSLVRNKMRLNGHALSDEEFTNLPYADQIIAVNKAIKDVVGESKTPLSDSAKE